MRCPDVSLSIAANEILCVVGESGSGKSIMANAIMRLLPNEVTIDAGRVMFEGRDLCAAIGAEMREVRGAGIAMIFQEPMTALNPLRTIGDQIGEMFSIHTDLSKAEINAKVLALLEDVRIPDPKVAAKAYPHELSGGQRQRAMIAMALALDPKLLIADEPTTALDVTTQAQILNLIRDLQKRKKTAVLFITHDFGVVAEIADRVAVMQHGLVVEQGTAASVLNDPQHAYTKQLIAAVPPLKAPPPRTLSTETILTIARRLQDLSHRRLPRPRRARDPCGQGRVARPAERRDARHRRRIRFRQIDAGALHRAADRSRRGRDRARGQRLGKLTREEVRRETRHIQMVFQDPFASLNPRRKAAELVAQGPIVHGTPRAQAIADAKELFALVGLDPSAGDRFPHEFSGGQRQRIGLARALALKPDVLVADEPVSALDVSVQAQVLKLLAELRAAARPLHRLHHP